MYKRSLLFLLFVCSTAFSFAQVTLTAANFNPVAGDAFISRNCDTTGVTEGPSGDNQVWNFTSLIDTMSVDTGLALSCAFMSPSCTWAIGANIGITSVSTLTTVRNYLYTDAVKLAQIGTYVSTEANLVFSDPMDQLHFPFTYNSTFNDNFAGILTFRPSGFPSPISAHQTGSEVVTCDAYGMLKLPRGITDTNTIRVHTFQTYRDNADVFSTLSDSFVFDTYTWYKPDFHTALLTIAIGHDVTLNVNYKTVSYTERPLITTPPPNNSVAVSPGVGESLHIYPNPATSELNINYRVSGSTTMKVTITDMLGRQVAALLNAAVQGNQSIRYNTSALPKGLYLVRLQSPEETITRRIEIR